MVEKNEVKKLINEIIFRTDFFIKVFFVFSFVVGVVVGLVVCGLAWFG